MISKVSFMFFQSYVQSSSCFSYVCICLHARTRIRSFVSHTIRFGPLVFCSCHQTIYFLSWRDGYVGPCATQGGGQLAIVSTCCELRMNMSQPHFFSSWFVFLRFSELRLRIFRLSSLFGWLLWWPFGYFSLSNVSNICCILSWRNYSLQTRKARKKKLITRHFFHVFVMSREKMNIVFFISDLEIYSEIYRSFTSHDKRVRKWNFAFVFEFKC